MVLICKVCGEKINSHDFVDVPVLYERLHMFSQQCNMYKSSGRLSHVRYWHCNHRRQIVVTEHRLNKGTSLPFLSER